MSFDPYKILGIETEATVEEIHSSYRKLCKTIHPDAGGGTDDFVLLTRAYEILSKPELRNKYDEIGIADDYVDEAIKNLQQLFVGILDTITNDNLPYVNIVTIMIQNISMQRGDILNSLNTLQDRKKKYEKSLVTIKHRLKSKKKNFLIYAAEESITKMLIPIVIHEKQIAMCDRMLELLENYEYEQDEAPIQQPSTGVNTIWNVIVK